MTDRLAELQGGGRYSDASAGSDVEAGGGGTGAAGDDEGARLLQGFSREAAAIEKVLVWADEAIGAAAGALARGGGGDANAQTGALDAVETKLRAVRRRLKKMADENRAFAAAHASRPATVRTRLVRYTKLGKDFIAATGRLAAVREKHRAALAAALRRDVRAANPAASEREVDDALNASAGGAQLDAVLEGRGSVAQHQVADMRARNADIQRLLGSVADLNQMFQDMSILVETQQTLINDIEYNVQEVKQDVKSAGDELVQARAHQKSKRKKQMCIIGLVVVILAIIVVAIVVAVLKNRPQPPQRITVAQANPAQANPTQRIVAGQPRFVSRYIRNGEFEAPSVPAAGQK